MVSVLLQKLSSKCSCLSVSVMYIQLPRAEWGHVKQFTRAPWIHTVNFPHILNKHSHARAQTRTHTHTHTYRLHEQEAWVVTQLAARGGKGSRSSLAAGHSTARQSKDGGGTDKDGSGPHELLWESVELQMAQVLFL
jgi:hypothetical protein